jgi:hypothetical protein
MIYTDLINIDIINELNYKITELDQIIQQIKNDLYFGDDRTSLNQFKLRKKIITSKRTKLYNQMITNGYDPDF